MHTVTINSVNTFQVVQVASIQQLYKDCVMIFNSMEYRKRTLSGSWDEAHVSLDDRLEQASRNICVQMCQLGLSMVEGLTNLTRSIFGCQRVTDSKAS